MINRIFVCVLFALVVDEVSIHTLFNCVFAFYGLSLVYLFYVCVFLTRAMPLPQTRLA